MVYIIALLLIAFVNWHVRQSAGLEHRDEMRGWLHWMPVRGIPGLDMGYRIQGPIGEEIIVIGLRWTHRDPGSMKQGTCE